MANLKDITNMLLDRLVNPPLLHIDPVNTTTVSTSSATINSDDRPTYMSGAEVMRRQHERDMLAYHRNRERDMEFTARRTGARLEARHNGIHVSRDEDAFTNNHRLTVSLESIPRRAVMTILPTEHPDDNIEARDLAIARQVTHQLAESLMPDVLIAISQLRDGERQRRHEMYGRPMFDMGHINDMVRGGIHGAMTGRFVNKPEAENPIEALMGIEQERLEFEFDDKVWKAKLLRTEMDVWNEAELMSHCIYKSYTYKMVAGNYIAYHITPPEGMGLPKSGWTIGFEKERGDFSWTFDQVRGKKNDRTYCDRPEIQNIIKQMNFTLNKTKEPQNET